MKLGFKIRLYWSVLPSVVMTNPLATAAPPTRSLAVRLFVVACCLACEGTAALVLTPVVNNTTTSLFLTVSCIDHLLTFSCKLTNCRKLEDGVTAFLM